MHPECLALPSRPLQDSCRRLRDSLRGCQARSHLPRTLRCGQVTDDAAGRRRGGLEGLHGAGRDYKGLEGSAAGQAERGRAKRDTRKDLTVFVLLDSELKLAVRSCEEARTRAGAGNDRKWFCVYIYIHRYTSQQRLGRLEKAVKLKGSEKAWEAGKIRKRHKKYRKSITRTVKRHQTSSKDRKTHENSGLVKGMA